MTAAAAGPGLPAPAGQRVALRHRLAERGLDRVLPLLVPCALALIALFCYPFLYGLQLSFHPASGGVFGAYRAFFDTPFASKSIGQTFALAVPASLINVGVSVPVAYQMRREFRGQRLLLALLVVPITLGTVLTAEGILEFCGLAGWFNRTLNLIGLASSPVHLTMSYTGVLMRVTFEVTLAVVVLSLLVAVATSQTLIVALFSAVNSAGIRTTQSIDAMAVMYTAMMAVLLVVALRFVNPTQLVARSAD